MLGYTSIHEDNLINYEVIEELELQICQFYYANSKDICDFFYYHNGEDLTSIPINEEIIVELLQPSQDKTVDIVDVEEDNT